MLNPALHAERSKRKRCCGFGPAEEQEKTFTVAVIVWTRPVYAVIDTDLLVSIQLILLIGKLIFIAVGRYQIVSYLQHHTSEQIIGYFTLRSADLLILVGLLTI